MKFYTFVVGGRARLGIELEGQLVDLAAGRALWSEVHGRKPGSMSGLPPDLATFLRLGTPAWEAAEETLAFFRKRPAMPVGEQIVYPFDGVRILAPIPRAGKIIRLVSWANKTVRFKLPNTVIGHLESLARPAGQGRFGVAGCVGWVLGRRLKNASEQEVQEAMIGCLLVHDAGFEGGDPLGWNHDQSCGLGPCLAAGKPGDFAQSRLTYSRNHAAEGEARAGDITPLLKWVAELSSVMTLEPADVIAAAPELEDSFQTAEEGDQLGLEMDGVGRLENTVQARR